MKNALLVIIAVITTVSAGVEFQRLSASEANTTQRFEYATVRWAGRDNTHVIRPGGKVEMAGPQLAAVKKPDKADERSFYQNVVMNALAKEGYEFAGISSDDIIMKRAVHQ
jgi:gamma-glutamylcysteine synthetase